MDLSKISQNIANLAMNEVLAGIRSLSLDELMKLTSGKSGHLNGATRSNGRSGRRTSEDIEASAKSISELLTHPDNSEGLRAEDIRTAVGIEKKDWLKPIAFALEAGWVRKEGDKRSTVYFSGAYPAPSTNTNGVGEEPKPAKTAAKSTKKPKAKASSKKTAKPPKKKAAKAAPKGAKPAKKKAPVKKTNVPKVTKSAAAPSEPPDEFPRPPAM